MPSTFQRRKNAANPYDKRICGVPSEQRSKHEQIVNDLLPQLIEPSPHALQRSVADMILLTNAHPFRICVNPCH